jgi:chorismate dehydratase
MRPRVGHIKYLNCFPLYYGLIKDKYFFDMELITGEPVELNNFILNDKLDISPISSIEYFRHKEKYLLFPNLTVSSNGHVGSVILFSKVPINELHEEKISLVNTSSTSNVLLRIILKYRYGIKPEYISCQPDLKSMLKKAKAALLIGDKALEESNKKNGLYYYDLGEEWQKLSGKKMVYALWCVRKSFAKENPDLVNKVLNALLKSSNYCQDHLKEIVKSASCSNKFSTQFIEKYLSELDFCLDKDAQEGLFFFSELAKESGWIKQNGDLEFFNYEGA